MTIALVYPVATEVIADARDSGRVMRVRWHPSDDVCVLSIWRDNTCAATFQLTRAEAPGLVNCLVQGLAQPPSPWSSTTHESGATTRPGLRRAVAGVAGRLQSLRPLRGHRHQDHRGS